MVRIGIQSTRGCRYGERVDSHNYTSSGTVAMIVVAMTRSRTSMTQRKSMIASHRDRLKCDALAAREIDGGGSERVASTPR